MKKLVLLIAAALLLSGCAAEETYETISDELLVPAMAQPREITVNLPGEAALPAMESDNGRAYLCQDYEIYVQTLEGGDMNATVQTLSGYEKDSLTVMETEQEGLKRYEFVWASAGEMGERIGRAVVLDDGSYHYTLTILRDEATTETSQISWDDIFSSFAVS
ncbi:MAG: hypothetical protein IJ001_03925 [Oscillospiraceae bacterium]|nr:hypothetical protein [Oscillospiraceae bacterium]